MTFRYPFRVWVSCCPPGAYLGMDGTDRIKTTASCDRLNENSMNNGGEVAPLYLPGCI